MHKSVFGLKETKESAICKRRMVELATIAKDENIPM